MKKDTRFGEREVEEEEEEDSVQERRRAVGFQLNGNDLAFRLRLRKAFALIFRLRVMFFFFVERDKKRTVVV